MEEGGQRTRESARSLEKQTIRDAPEKARNSRPVRPLPIRRGNDVHPVGLDVLPSIGFVDERAGKSGEVDVVAEDLVNEGRRRVSRTKTKGRGTG